ncbi:hypothetical protein Tco_0409895, partial [Tanacetum coccineum]
MDKEEITRKPSKTGKHGHEERKSTKEAGKSSQSQKVKKWECHVDVKKAQEKRDFTLLSLREQAQTSHQWIASLAIRLMEGELDLEGLPRTLLAYLRISQSC